MQIRITPEERDKIRKFLKEIIKRDHKGGIKNILWGKYSESIRNLLRNPYVYNPFWQHVRGSARGNNWESRFKKTMKKLNRLLEKDKTDVDNEMLILSFEKFSFDSMCCAIRFFTAAQLMPRDGARPRSETAAESWLPSCRKFWKSCALKSKRTPIPGCGGKSITRVSTRSRMMACNPLIRRRPNPGRAHRDSRSGP